MYGADEKSRADSARPYVQLKISLGMHLAVIGLASLGFREMFFVPLSRLRFQKQAALITPSFNVRALPYLDDSERARPNLACECKNTAANEH